MKSLKVLQAVYSMDRGGVETWLMHILRNIDRCRYQIDFVTFSVGHGDFDSEIESMGSRIFPCAPPSRLWSHVRDFRSVLEQHGPYDVVHSHDATWNGVILAIAKKMGVPIRIAHSHNDILKSLPSDLVRSAYTKWSIWKSKQYATHGLACSKLAASTYYGKDWETDPRWSLFYCGQDFSPFIEEVDRRLLRQSLGLKNDAFIIGHVGSFRNKQKNHEFLIKVASELAVVDKAVYWLMVGDGILRTQIEKECERLGLKDRVIFTGTRSDVPQLMQGAMDMFLFPSLFEGLGLAMIEAQAAGLPCICSDTIPEEVDIIPSLITRISLKRSPSDWAHSIMSLRRSKQLLSREEVLQSVRASPFSLTATMPILERIYSGHPEVAGD